MSTSTLYEIVSQAQAIERAIAEAGGELTPEIEKVLMNVDLSLSAKVEGYAQVIDHLDNEALFWAKRAAEADKIAKSIQNAKKRLNERVKEAMIALGKKEVEGETIRFQLVENKGSLVIDETKLPQTHKMQVTEWVADKEKIRADLEALQEVPGAELKGGYALRKYAARGR